MSANFFEILENRQMLAASVSDGTLTVTGSNAANTITIAQLANGNVRVTENATVNTFASASVQRIRVNANGGNDRVTIETSVTRRATIRGGAGNDTITGSNQNDRILGDSGNDTINGRGGHDFVHGGSGTDNVRGGSGNDSVYAGTGSGRDVLRGEAGNDTLVSLGGGQDSVLGGSGTDSFWTDKAIGIEIFGGTPADITDATTGEKNAGLLHEVEAFQQLKRVNVPIINEQTQQPSRELSGQNLLDPNPVSVLNSATNNATFADFSDRDLFTTGNPTMNDVNQGGVGNCYFQATVASIAKVNPTFLKRHVVDLGDGTYAVRFKGLFGDEFVRVDGDLPVDSSGNLLYGGLGDNGTIWAAVMEKAWAFRRFGTGRYDTTTAGNPLEVYAQLGIASTDASLTGFNTTAMMNKIRTDLAAGRAATATTNPISTASTSRVLAAHVYVIDRVNLDASGNVASLRLFNPHGVDNVPSGSTDDANPSDGLVTITPAQFMNNFVAYNAANA